MELLRITGGIPLRGDVHISGAKNAVLPILSASLLTDGCVRIGNVPHLDDITTIIALLRALNVDVIMQENMWLEVNSSAMNCFEAPYDLARQMRASILVLGPMLARFGNASVPLPGGCAIGSRPVDLHLQGLRAMGAEIELQGGKIMARVQGRLRGAHIMLDKPTVTGTENLMMAASLARGTTILENAAKEPEIIDLAQFLNAMGAEVEGAGSSRIVICGKKSLGGVEYQVMPDRIEAATYLIAGAITGGRVRVHGIDSELLESVLVKLEQAHMHVIRANESITVETNGQRPRSVDVLTMPYPGFPTDLQAQFMAFNCIGEGSSTITESIFENRFMHVHELKRLGANIQVKGSTALIYGVEQLMAAPVRATDLRASAGLVLAALAACGETVLEDVHHIDRGYECIEEKLGQLGARIFRRSDGTTPYEPIVKLS